jgi:hypothetical protein
VGQRRRRAQKRTGAAAKTSVWRRSRLERRHPGLRKRGVFGRERCYDIDSDVIVDEGILSALVLELVESLSSALPPRSISMHLALAVCHVALVLQIYTHKDRRKSAPTLDAVCKQRWRTVLFEAELGGKGRLQGCVESPSRRERSGVWQCRHARFAGAYLTRASRRLASNGHLSVSCFSYTIPGRAPGLRLHLH